MLDKTTPENIKQLSDREIIEQYLEKGESVYLGCLYDRYAQKIFRKCVSMLKNREDAEDLAHDIITKVFLNIGKFRGEANLSTWIYRVTYNACIDFLRKKQRNRSVELLPEVEGFDGPYDNEGIRDKQILEDKILILEEAFTLLSGNEKALLLMKYQDGMQIKEIAEVLNIAVSATKMRLKRAREKLKHKYFIVKHGKHV